MGHSTHHHQQRQQQERWGMQEGFGPVSRICIWQQGADSAFGVRDERTLLGSIGSISARCSSCPQRTPGRNRRIESVAKSSQRARQRSTAVSVANRSQRARSRLAKCSAEQCGRTFALLHAVGISRVETASKARISAPVALGEDGCTAAWRTGILA